MTSLTSAWNYPTRVLFGPGRIADLASACGTAGIKRPLLVTDAGLKDADITRRALDLVDGAGLKVALFSDVKGNPTNANVEAGVAAYRAHEADGVIAFGGGSGLDVGKLVAFMVGQTRPVWDFEDVGDWWTRADAAKIAPIVAVPTTAGTGSEVGRAAVVTNEETHEKKIIFHPKMLPAIVVSDPELTVGLPPKLTAWTGFDALAHCLEAFAAPGFHPMADGIAVNGARLIKTYLPRAVADGSDIEARANMLAAASMGAAAFQKGLGAIHSMSHPVGAMYDTHHGLTNGVVMPYVFIRNRPAIEERFARLAKSFDIEDGFDGFIEWVLAFRAKLHVADTLAELGVDEARIDEMAEKAERDPSTAGNPLPLKAPDFAQLFRAAIRGDLDAARG
ncbi:iron-containing alcohol dehydrogenase [Hansschlegelia zhihuaiae]|uniref:Alcohol dehydrogenase 2 n=1 Tax=Hansschlegelia zhihuaiae TaxID=405005 RepID=A0A4Q0M676_9HYPH|nr:iron-containing alcohol dehydrogenase [Hansschlegelia zhihuaiae]RXF68548.1 iron-containing alcohol dehydrogenase [Hansschlegelia zhihuaiae]